MVVPLRKLLLKLVRQVLTPGAIGVDEDKLGQGRTTTKTAHVRTVISKHMAKLKPTASLHMVMIRMMVVMMMTMATMVMMAMLLMMMIVMMKLMMMTWALRLMMMSVLSVLTMPMILTVTTLMIV